VNRRSVKSNDLGWQFRQITFTIEDLLHLLEGGQYVNGPNVIDFESKFAAFSESKFAVGVNSGTSALHAILESLGVGPGDEVIVPSLTFIATISAVLLTGATPVIVDVDENGLMNALSASTGMSSKTKAIIPVHLWGSPIAIEEMNGLKELSNYVIEDCSQAHGAKFTDQTPVGKFGIAGAWSLYPGKNLGGVGEGGVITTDSSGLAKRLSEFRNWGTSSTYFHKDFGLNYRMDEINAFFLSKKLEKLTEWNTRRIAIANTYKHELKNIKFVNNDKGYSVYHQFVISLPNRDALKAHLEGIGISTQIHYPIPNHQVEFLNPRCRMIGNYANSENLSESILSLPVHPGLSNEDVSYVIEAINEFNN